MPATEPLEPLSWKVRNGIEDKPVYYAPSWMTCPFETYENFTQQQFQDATVPYTAFGSKVPVSVPKGWRRVEGAIPGKMVYINPATGSFTKYCKETYDCVKECWLTPEQEKISAEEIAMSPAMRTLDLAIKMGAIGVPQAAIVPVAKEEAKPKAKAKEEKEERTPLEDTAKEETKVEEAKPAEEAKPEVEAVPEALPPAEPPLPAALLFPGQGSQYVKMLSGVKDLPAVKDMLDKATEILGYDILEICLKGPESKLEQTKFCQPAMYIGGLAAIEKLRTTKPEVVERRQAVAGLSLGEYTALTIAGVLDFETGLKIVKLRGEAMQEAAEASKQLMLSVAGLSMDQLNELCKDSLAGPDDVCQIANFLFPNGFSCAGSAEAVEKLMAKAQKTENCMQAKLLKTSGAFHTKLMEPARAKLLAALKEVEGKLKPPKCDVYMNLTGKRITPATKPADIVPMLGDQLCNCVLWEPAVKEMIEDGITSFYECGPMKQLKAMMKRIDPPSYKATTTVDV